MPVYENIEGNKLLSIFEQLISQQILVKVYLPQVDYENLTLITETRNAGKQPMFIIDIPNGLQEAIDQAGAARLFFEFTSSDRVTHRFNSTIESISAQSISLLYPPLIQRHQQRDNFRVKAPSGSYATIVIEDFKIQMEIENVSLGGMYCYCLNKYKPMMAQLLETNEMELVFDYKNQCFHISIQGARIKRMESRHRPKHFGIAFEFLQIKGDAKKLLVRQIYELQRAFLKNRLKILKTSQNGA